MRLKPFLICSGADEVHFNGLRRNDNLPFASDPESGGWTQFSIEDAVRLRVMLDLMGEDHRTSEYLAGLPPSYAKKIASNARAALSGLPDAFEAGGDVWVGVLVVQARAEGDGQFTEWFTGTLSDLAPWVAAKTKPDEFGRAKPVRLFLANASEAARIVRQRALDLSLFDKAEELA